MISTMDARPKASMRYLLQLAEQLRQADQQDGGDDHADLAAHATQHDDGQDHRGFDEGEALGADEALPGGEERPGKAAEHGADAQRR